MFKKHPRDVKMPDNINILMVEDNTGLRENLADILSVDGYKVKGVGTIELGKKELKSKFYNIMLLDFNLPDGNGLELLKELKNISKDTVAIVCTGVASIENAIASLNEGAFAYLQKPVNMDELKIFIKRSLDLQELSIDNRKLLDKLKELSLKDTHTELYNYKYLMERLDVEIKRSKRYNLPLSLLMLDIDDFKSINEAHTHQYGDRILKEFAEYLKHFVRASDIVTRYGGEEFVILLTDTNKKGAVIFGKRLLEAIEKEVFDSKGKKVKLKVSMGLAGFPEDGASVETASGLLNSVDSALLNAKKMGGNRVSLFKSKKV